MYIIWQVDNFRQTTTSRPIYSFTLLKFLLSLYHIYGTMEIINLLHFKDRSELRQWLTDNHCKEKCCWVVTYRSKCPEWLAIPYIEVVEEALCFGWIDSTLKRLPDGRLVQRLSPRRPKGHWTQLNLDRCMELEDRGLMTDAGRSAFEKAFEYEVVTTDSEMNRMIEDENKLRRPKLYK